jgi:sugar phosphate isomerase/epimerase
MQFKFAAFADESSPILSGQIDALKRNGFDYLEIRNINGKNISDLTLSEAKEIAAQLADQGLAVKSLGSPIGKIQVDGDYASHLDLYKHTLDLAGVFGADKIRLFSFYIPKGMDPVACRDTVLRRMDDFVVLAKPHDVTACHENEKGIYGDIAVRCLDLHRNVPGLAAVFDPANFIQCGQDTLEGWEMLCDYVNYMHVKDALPDGRVVPPGEGIGYVPVLLEKFAAQGGKLLSLEPHLSDFVGLKALEREGEESIVGALSFESNEAAFDHAAKALKKLLG